MLCSPSPHWVINQHRYIPGGLWLTSTDIQSWFVLPPEFVRILWEEEALSCSFWYLPLSKNSAFNKVNIHKMLTEWIYEPHRLYLSQWLEMLRRFWRKCPESYFIDITQAPSREDFLEGTSPSAQFWGLQDDAPPVMRILVWHNWLIFRYRRKDICEIGIASEWL